jgi:RNA polymerase sigma factor (sigma-70 family)
MAEQALPWRVKYRADPCLIQACLEGDETAWNELIARYQRLVYSIPRRYGLSAADASDVFQNVFEIVYRRLDSLRDQTAFSAWLVRVTQRATLQYLKGRRGDLELSEDVECPGDRLDADIARLETQQLVREAIAQLDPQCRKLLGAFLADTRPSYEQIAKILGCPLGSIGPMRGRCLAKLEHLLKEVGVDLLQD